MKTTEVFDWNLEAYHQYKGTNTVIANQGGQGSSKTISILQILYLANQLSKRKLITTIGSYALPHLKAGAMNDFDKILIGEGIYPDNVCNRSESKYFIGKSEIEFVGIEGNEARVTGPRRDILYINEANKRIRYDVFDLANSRTSLITFIDFNPSREFWFQEKIVPSLPYHLIKSNFNNNQYLPERERQNILSKKDKPGFENWWKVYGEGELGQLEDAIIQNWKIGEFDDSLPYGYGLDFGSRHPDAMVKCAVDHNKMLIYWKEEIYMNGKSTAQLIEVIKNRNINNKLIVADSQATRTILDLRLAGINVVPVSKNRIVDDIKMIWGYTVIVDKDSINLQRNLNNWIWLDKKGEIPIDIDDDLIDAGRYILTKLISVNPKRKGNRAV